MEIKVNAQDRKALVKSLSEHLSLDAAYMGPPSFAYKVGDLVITRDCTIETENEEQFTQAKAAMVELGYIEDESTLDGISVQVPIAGMDGIALRNLVYTLSSKQYLLNRVLGVEHMRVDAKLIEALQVSECNRASEFLSIINSSENGLKGLSFADGYAVFDFPDTGNPTKNRALVSLAALMVHSAKEAKRVNPTNQVVENEKYYLRIWLVRLGLSGQGGQETRRALLDGLKGHTAFRTPEEAARFSANQKAKREATKAAAAELSTPTHPSVPATVEDINSSEELTADAVLSRQEDELFDNEGAVAEP